MCRITDDGGKRSDRTRRRKKLWEMETGFHCSLIGTCASLSELRKILRKTKVVLPRGVAEYQIHGAFVHAAEKPEVHIRCLQKLLERKHHSSIKRFKSARTTEEVGWQWEEALKEGDVPGPYWGLMTHPQADEALLARAFGQVHMLSHLVGAANRADIRRLVQLEKENQGLHETLSEVRSAGTRAGTSRARRIEELEHRFLEFEGLEARLAQAEKLIGELENGTEIRSLRDRVGKLDRLTDLQDRREEAARRRSERLEVEMSALQKKNVSLQLSLATSHLECAALQDSLDYLSSRTSADGCLHCQGPDQCPKLLGMKVLYVGGRTGLASHYRDLVEKCGGRMIHHDGGLEESPSRLSGCLLKADAVICPMDCVSHDAYRNLKKVCKRYEKPMVMMRTAGLASLASGLQQLVTAQTAHKE